LGPPRRHQRHHRQREHDPHRGRAGGRPLFFGSRNNRIDVTNNAIGTQGFDSFGIDFDEANRNATVTGNTITTEGPSASAASVTTIST